MKVAIASDHAGFQEKEVLVEYIDMLGHEVLDFGPTSEGRVDYPDYALQVAKAVASGQADKGVLICGTGIGMAIAANKIPGIRAANVTTPEFAALSREHNDSNVLTLSARFTDEVQNKACIYAFLTTEFEGGRHSERLAKITQIEEGC